MPISIRLPEEVERRLNELAVKTGRSKTFYATEAILEHLEDIEDLYLAEQELIEIRAGRSQTYSLEEVERSLDLAD
ncbi:TraY domain-containing protein [Acidithiobacillus ferrooxidans]|nr:TraY domain-containing protein [Acidithiobacillus ferrooxidans]